MERAVAADQAFRHEARFYAGEDEFLEGALRFVREGLANGEQVMVAVSKHKIELLESSLNGDGGRVIFRDMGDVGGNPARIIPAWQQFVDDYAGSGRSLRGIGEPIWPGRSEAELAEAHIHEALLNRAFASVPGFWLQCPYDESVLPAETIATAERNHPSHAPHGHDSTPYASDEGPPDTLGWDVLSEPGAAALTCRFGIDDLGAIRAVAEDAARSARLGRSAREDFVLSVNELASNSIRHGGGAGTLWLWCDASAVYCQVDDRGRISDPMVGRVKPLPDGSSGRGLWLANQTCDLVQIRSGNGGTTVRIHVSSADHDGTAQTAQ